MKLSHADYRATCNEAFTVKISDPSVFWNQTDGFYVAPSAQLVPNTDLCVGLAYYSLNNNCARSLSGSRREYAPIAQGIRLFFSTPAADRNGSLRQYIQEATNDAEYERERN